MAAIITNYAVQQFMLEMKDGSGTIPTSFYLAAYKVLPAVTLTSGLGGTEIDSAVNTWYARQAITLGSPSGRTQANTNTITFTNNAASAVSGAIVGCAVVDHLTAGNVWIVLPGTTSITVGLGSQLIVPIGQMIMEFAAA